MIIGPFLQIFQFCGQFPSEELQRSTRTVIPLWRTNEELLPGNALSRVVLSSLDTRWNDILVEQHHLLSSELADVTYKRHVVVNSNLFNTIKLQKKTPHY